MRCPGKPHCIIPRCIYCSSKTKEVVSAAKPKKPLPKPTKPIPQQSKKRIKEQRIYRKILDKKAAENNLCEVRSPVCTGYMEGGNHIQPRLPSNFIDPDNIERSCNVCNWWITNTAEGQAWAKQNGHHISRHKKIEKTIQPPNHD